MRMLAVMGLSAALLSSVAVADEPETTITIYSKQSPGAVQPHLYRPSVGGWQNHAQIPGYAVVKQMREIKLKDKRNEVVLDDVAALIDPTTVAFKSLTDPEGTSVLEQSYLFDLVSPQKLAERYLGKEIEIQRMLGEELDEFEGTLLSTQNGLLTIRDDEGSIVTANLQEAVFPALPDELYTKPTLVWDVVTRDRGEHEVEVAYQTEGITWWADYNATFKPGKNANEGTLDLGAWVSIVNKSGAAYEDAKLKLIAGDVQRAQAPQRSYRKGMVMESMAMAADAAGFSEKSLFEFHLYTLGARNDDSRECNETGGIVRKSEQCASREEAGLCGRCDAVLRWV